MAAGTAELTLPMRPFPGAFLPARQALLVALASGLVSACAVPSDGPRLSPATPATMGLAAAASVDTPAIAPDWWQALGDPQLDRLIADALSGNPTLAGAEARLAAARAALGEAKAARLPHAEANASLERERFSANYIYPPPYGGQYYWISDAETDLSWSLDLAGRQRALVRAAGARANAAALDTAAARVALSGAMAQAYIAFANTDAQLTLADERIATRREWLKLSEARVASGLAGEIELRATQAAVANALQTQAHARGERELALHLLAALAGRGVDYAAAITPPTLHTDTALPLPTRLSADLLGQRADILAARARIDASVAERSARRADFYPDIDLSAFIGLQSLGIGMLAHGSSGILGAGPALHLPIFEGGQLTAAYRAATAQNDAAIAAYNEAVVRGVREAADALSAVATSAAETESQRAVVGSVFAGVKLIQSRVDNGLEARSDLIGANDALITAKSSMATIAAEGATRRIRLLVALGGGFTPLPPSGARAPSDNSVSRPQP